MVKHVEQEDRDGCEDDRHDDEVPAHNNRIMHAVVPLFQPQRREQRRTASQHPQCGKVYPPQLVEWHRQSKEMCTLPTETVIQNLFAAG